MIFPLPESLFRIGVDRCASGSLYFGSRKKVRSIVNRFVCRPSTVLLSLGLFEAWLLVGFSFISMIVDASQSASASAPAAAGGVNGIPGVLAAVNDPIQFDGRQVEVQIPVHPNFQSGGGQVAIPGFQSGAVQPK